MTLGTIIAYVGISILIGSFAALVVVALFAATLIGYLKIISSVNYFL
jgi:protein-S-isoprenylcysteine O-methyltransferase Ste14